MASFEQYAESIYKIAEGPECNRTDYKGRATKYGVSAELYQDAMGKALTDNQLCAMSWEQLKPVARWVWNKFKGDNIKSQKVADMVIDHAQNKGWVGQAYTLQYFLNDRYGSKLAEDGKVGNLTIGALNAAIDKYGEDKVYMDYRDVRVRWLRGEAVFASANRDSRWTNGYANTQMGDILITNRINRFFPPIMGVFDEDITPLSTADIYKGATGSFFNPKSLKDWLVLIVAIIGVVWLVKVLMNRLNIKAAPPKMAVA